MRAHRYSGRARRGALGLLAVAVAAATAASTGGSAQSVASAPGAAPAASAVQQLGSVDASGTVKAGKPTLRRAPDEGAAAARPTRSAPFRPTMGRAAYRAAKAAANAAESGKPGVQAPDLLVPPSAIRQWEGLNQSESGGLRPPDNDGAHGDPAGSLNQYVATVNSAIRVYDANTTPPTIVSTKSLATFFGYTTTTIFDPRVMYDTTWDRWVVMAEAFPESATVQRVFIAVSRTSNANGAYWIYNVDRGGSGAGEVFWDYGQLGMDQDALLFTANIFPNSGGFAGAELFCFSKAGMYNGLGVSSPVFSGLDATLAPPHVLDNSSNTFLLAAPNQTAALSLYRANNCGRSGTTLVKQANIAVPAYAVPPDAPQPGTTDLLDTIDNRFQNRSTQYGNRLWNVHTLALGSFAAPKWYELNTTTNSVVQSDTFFRSGTSDDFNPSLHARPDGTMFVSWTATDPSVNVNAQVRFSGRLPTDPLNTTNEPGQALFTSGTFYNPSTSSVERWGDYSAVVDDDSTTLRRAYIVSEKINSSTVWGSRIGHIGF